MRVPSGTMSSPLARSSFQCALVMAGEVSVEPQEVVNHTGSSRTRRAVLGARSSKALMAPEVRSRARSSRTCPSRTRTVITAAASK